MAHLEQLHPIIRELVVAEIEVCIVRGGYRLLGVPKVDSITLVPLDGTTYPFQMFDNRYMQGHTNVMDLDDVLHYVYGWWMRKPECTLGAGWKRLLVQHKFIEERTVTQLVPLK